MSIFVMCSARIQCLLLHVAEVIAGNEAPVIVALTLSPIDGGRPLSPSVWLSAFFIYRPLHSLAPVSDGCRIKCWGQKEKGRGGLNLLWLYVEIT